MVIFLSEQYIQSEACLTELVSAVMHRDPKFQLTLLFCPRVVNRVYNKEFDRIEKICALLGRHFGEECFFSDGNKMLAYLADHVYGASTDVDRTRLINYYRHFSTAEESLRRDLRLQAPLVKRKQSIYPFSLNCTWFPERGSIVQGKRYIDRASLRIGDCSGVSKEHVFFFSGTFFAIWFFCQLNARCISHHKMVCDPNFFAGGVLLMIGGACACLQIMIGVYVDLDPRNFHDPILLPLNAAAFCSSASAMNKKTAHGPDSDEDVPIVRFILQDFSAAAAVTPASNGAPDPHISASSQCLPQPGAQASSATTAAAAGAAALLKKYADFATEKRVLKVHEFITHEIGLVSRVDRIDFSSSSSSSSSTPSSALATLINSTTKTPILVFVIVTKDMAREFLSIVHTLDTSCFFVITLYDLLYCDIMPSQPDLKLGNHCVILLGENHGIDTNAPYEGFANAVLDNIGCKLGSRFCS